MTNEEKAFEIWWNQEGSAMRPREGDDHEAHAYRMTRIAWLNGAFKATEASLERLRDGRREKRDA